MKIVKELIKYYLYMVSIFFLGRVVLLIIYFDKYKDSGENFWFTFLHGLRMDTMLSCIILTIPLLLLTFSPISLKKYVNIFYKLYFLLILSIIIYIEIATFPFMNQYEIRPNFIFIEYINFPKEIFNMVIHDYLFEFISAIIILILFIYQFFKKYNSKYLNNILEIAFIKRVTIFIPLLIILFLGARSSIGQRPANLSDALWSKNRAINEISKNSIQSILTAVYVNYVYKDNTNYAKQYGNIKIKHALERTKKLLNIKSVDELSPLKRLEISHFKKTKTKNIVIFLQESMGARFVGVLGGEKGITPNIDKLSNEGILFKDTYSNGTRSNRGIVGVTSGIFSVPGKQILKRNKASSDFFNIASLLKPFNYETYFIYGGEARFDNMKNWMMGNGFTGVVEEKDFENPIFKGTWGVSDEDLVIKANEKFKELYAKKQKFATLMFSQSSHAPYEYPKGRISPINNKKSTLRSALKFADFSIGKFFELAKKEEYYKDTIFVVIADHNARYIGNEMVPVSQFQIPALILGEGVEPLVYERITTQPDVIATALDLAGLDLEYPIFGHSIFSDKKTDIALLQFHTSYALRVGNKVAVLRPNKKPVTFLYKNKKMIPTSHDLELEKNAIAIVTTIDHFYNKRLYK